MWGFPPAREAQEIRASALAASQGGTAARRVGAMVDDADQEDAIEGESAVMSVPSIQWKPNH